MRSLLLTLLLFANVPAQAFFFPEFPFCPLGGPPGWFNRMSDFDDDDDDYRYPPPHWYPPYPAQHYPYSPPYAWPQPACGTNGANCPPR